MATEPKFAPHKYYDRVAFVLQGGGALGAYQVGVVKALSEYQVEPDWVVGTSIGAINGSIIVGNPPEKRLEKLKEFWHRIATPDYFMPYHLFDSYYAYLHRCWGAQMSLCFGQPGFFVPKLINPWFMFGESPQKISFYDTSLLKKTLEDLIDFDYLNSNKIVLKIGAVNVTSGKLIYFNNQEYNITADHILASSALPPGFPAVKINGEYFWDGGVHSNTPLTVVLDALPIKNTLCFMVDLFSGIGPNPDNLDAVIERKKDITFSSHSKRTTNLYSTRQNLRHAISVLGEHLTEEAKQDPAIQEILQLGTHNIVDIVHLIYDSQKEHLESKDYNFSKLTLDNHQKIGYLDTQKAFQDASWSTPRCLTPGVQIYTAPTNPKKVNLDVYE